MSENTNYLHDNDTALADVDFLSLAEKRKVARVDMSRIGYAGVYYVVDMSASVRTAVVGRMSGRAKINRDSSMEIDMKNMPQDGAQRIVKFCLVKGVGVDLEREFKTRADNGLFETNGDGRIVEKWPSIMVDATQVTTLWPDWLERLGTEKAVREKVGAIPHAVTNEITAAVRFISGMTDEAEVDQKKES